MKHLFLSFLCFFSSAMSAQNEELLSASNNAIDKHPQFILTHTLNSQQVFSDSSITTQNTDPQTRAPLILDAKTTQVTLQTSNGCGIGNFIIPCMGDVAQGIPPTIGSLYLNGSPIFRNVDTIPGNQIKGIAFTRVAWMNNASVIETGFIPTPYVVISDTGMFSYLIPIDYTPSQEPVLRIDSLFIPNIRKVATQITTNKTNPIVLFIEDSTNHYRLHFHDYPGLNLLSSLDFHFEPEIFEVIDSSLFITGQDTNGTIMLYHFDAFQGTLDTTYVLNNLVANAKELLVENDSVFILSSPNDSVTILTTVNRFNSTVTQTTVYNNSGARATYNDYQGDPFFTFQPISDTSNNMLHKQILILNPLTHQVNTLLINKELDLFKSPVKEFAGFGYFDLDWIGIKKINGALDSVYLKNSFGIIDLETNKNPRFINATHGCWVSVPHRELEKIKFKLYPNPASTTVTLKLSGLEKGRPYELNVIGLDGKIHYTTNLEAYQELKIPVDMLSQGVYFLKLDTGRNIITQKLIVQ